MDKTSESGVKLQNFREFCPIFLDKTPMDKTPVDKTSARKMMIVLLVFYNMTLLLQHGCSCFPTPDEFVVSFLPNLSLLNISLYFRCHNFNRLKNKIIFNKVIVECNTSPLNCNAV